MTPRPAPRVPTDPQPPSAAAPVRPRRLFVELLREHLGRYVPGFLLLGLTNVLALSIPRFLKHSVEAIQANDRRALATWAAIIVAVALLQALVRTQSRLLILGACRVVVYRLRARLFRHLQDLPLTFYGGRSIGDITSRAINDMLLVRSLFGFGLMNLVNTALVYVAAIVMMMVIDWRLTLIALAPYPVFILAVNRLSRRVYQRTLAVQDQMSTLTSQAQENIAGINLIKTFAREEAESAEWSGMSQEYLRRTLSLARARGAMVPIMGIMASTGSLVVLGLGGTAVIRGRITLGDFVAFSAYLAYLVWPTLAFGWLLNTFQRGAAALRRIAEILSESVEERALPEAWRDRPVGGTVTVRGLTFAHADAPPGTAHLREIDLDVPAGSSLGILGTVGAGKSTLVGFLPRILTPPPGTVFVDGVDVRDLPLARLRRDIAMVPQEPFLFSRSLRENLLMGDPGATSEGIDEAARASRLANDLDRFPDGLDTVVGERGVTLSGGQRQRATIARALLADPRLLILDDALSSLDAEVERDVVEEIRRQRRGRTTILISHRVASLSWADRVIVLDAGRVVESGTHEDLIRSGGLYARIARRQSLVSRLEES